MIASSLRLALAQLPDPAFRRVLIRSLLISVAIFAVLAVGLWVGVASLPDTGQTWIDWLVGFLSGLGFFVGMLLLFPAVMTAAIGLFLDDIADAVERKYYPQDARGQPLPFWPALWGSIRFLLVVLGINILLLPIYAVLIFFPPFMYALSLLVNGFLVSREYFEVVAWRYLPRKEADRLRQRHRGDLWLCGAIIVLLLTIPLINFLVPIVATAFMVHVYKRLRATG
jgi:CysZ protein